MGARVIFAVLLAGVWACAQQPGATAQAAASTPRPSATSANVKSSKPAKAAPVNIRVSVNVVDPKGVPVPSAGVIIRQNLDAKGFTPHDPFQVELKTDPKGNVQVQGFEPGQISVQVIAHGFQTWGELIVMKNPDEAVSVKLSLPKAQVTIY